MNTAFWDSIDFKGHIKGNPKLLCPACSHNRKKKTDPCLNVDLDQGVYYCHHCHVNGSKNIFVPMEKKEPAILPKLNTGKLSDKTFKWLNEVRMLSNNTIKRNQITDGDHYFPQVNASRNSIWFNYFVDGNYTNTKFRDAEKNFAQVKNAEKHFYKIDDIKNSDTVIVAEGEIDALSWEEAGYLFAVSVPDGAISPKQVASDKKFEFIDNDIERFAHIKKVILAQDNDANGQAMQKELSRRFGRERCWTVDFGEYKDANDILQALGRHDGVAQLVSIFEAAKPYPLSGIETVSDHAKAVFEIYENGIDSGSGIGYYELDEHIRWLVGWMYVITGVPGHGKSNWFDQVMCKLVSMDWKFGVYSPEHIIVLHIHRLCKILSGKPFWGNGRIPVSELKELLAFLERNIFFIRPDNEDFSLDNILFLAKQLVVRHGIKGLVIDPWNTIDHQRPKGMDKGDFINQSLGKLNMFKQQHDCAVIIMAHPTKMEKNNDGTYKVPTGYSISDSAHFYNKADVGITVYRNKDNTVDVEIWKIKFEGLIGKKGVVKFSFNQITNEYIAIGEISQSVQSHYEVEPRSNIPRPNEEDIVPF